jgi:CheY-like chemotaxis protein
MGTRGIGETAHLGTRDTVLLVHSDDVNRAALIALLESAHFSVSGVSSGEDALRLLGDNDGFVPCLIIYVMTGAGDGSQAFRTAQLADSELATVPIVMFSGDSPRPAADDGPRDRGYPAPFVGALLALVGRHCARAEYAA